MARLQLSPIVGEARPEEWSQVVVLPQGSGEVALTKLGVVVVAVTVRTEGTTEAGEVGRELLSSWREQFDQLPPEADDPLTIIEVPLAWQKWVQDCVAVWFAPDGRVKLLGYGKVTVVIKRGEKLGTVFAGVKDKWQKSWGNTDAGDRWLIGTSGLVGEMSTTLIQETLDYETAQQAAEELSMLIYKAEENSAVAGVVVHVMIEKDTVPEPKGKRQHFWQRQRQEREAQKEAPAVYLKVPNRRRKMAISVGLILLVLLGVSVFMGWRQREKEKWQTAYEAVVKQSEELLTQARAAETEQAIALGNQAAAVVETALPEFTNKEPYEEQLQAQLARAKEQAAEIAGKSQVSEVPVWYDLNLLREGMVGAGMGTDGKNVLVIDGDKSLMAAIGTADKQAGLVGGGELLAEGTLVTGSGDRAIVYRTEGITEVDTKNKTTGELIASDAEWGRIVGIGLFAGNAYLLDAGKGEIWVYPGLAAGAGARQRWLKGSYEEQLKEATDMVIDGDIWVATKTGEVYRFRRGARENFTLSGIPGELGEVVAIYSDEETEQVYLLDRGNKRVVVVTKEGEYVKQYEWTGLAGVTDMVVNEIGGQILLLSGGSIYGMAL